MTSNTPIKHLLGIKGLSASHIQTIFETADNFKELLNGPVKKTPALRDITIANLFFENSTRTRVSFELAEKRLGADIINFSSSSSSVKKGETLIDTVNNILSMKVDMVVMRHPAPGACLFLSKHIDAQIINAGDGTHEHPTQALLDAFSIRERLGDVAGKKVVIVGDILHSRVALSNIYSLQLLGAEVMVIQLERQDQRYFPSLKEYSNLYGLTLDKLNRLDKEICIMHPGPINRGVEITSDVADSKHSMILQQVENGVAVRMAVLFLLGQQRL